MQDIADRVKRIFVGRPMSTANMGHTLLSKKVALPVFASDALSSVAYAPDEVFLTLALAGMAALSMSIWVGLAVAVVLVVVVASYRQTVHAYPSGGGDYEVATVNFGPLAGLTVASALLCDYILTVAVSISQGAAYLSAAMPSIAGHEAAVACALVVILAVLNLRGVRESGTAFAIPTYLYMGAVGLMAVVGVFKDFTGTLAQADAAKYDLVAAPGYESGLIGFAGAFLVLRAFSSGCAALTGVEAISNGVPVFRKPKSKNAATTLLMLGIISVSMLISVIYLAQRVGVKLVEEPAKQLLLDGKPVTGIERLDPVIGQIAATVFADARPLFLLVTIVTGLILILASNTAFNGFPTLASVLSKDSFLPRQMYTRGDRLAFSNGIVVLAGAAIVLILAFDAQVTKLIQLYIVGVFISFTTSQAGMLRHWNRQLKHCTDPAARRKMKHSRIVNAIGLVLTGTVLLIVLVTKFTHGAWITLTMMAVLIVTMTSISRHYARVSDDLQIPDKNRARTLPSRVHAMVLVSKLHKPAMRAIAYARATAPSSLEIVTVDLDPEDTKALLADWRDMAVPVPLTILATPFREITRPVLSHVKAIRRTSPNDLVVVYIPEYLVQHWWQRVLHNQSAFRLRTTLKSTPGVVLASVPWTLGDNSTAKPAKAKSGGS